ncbi:fibronectin type III domain-containing protein [Kineococcus gynurae]|uniref:Fibronectin type III domain-containing protein n=1 Tax=Kineococcus gynurae TaxID=452979 RepID=A0ABV5LSC0_9ACTN
MTTSPRRAARLLASGLVPGLVLTTTVAVTTLTTTTAAAVPQTFTPASGTQTFSAGGCRVFLDITGASGASASSTPGAQDGLNRGGRGGRVVVSVPVSALDQVTVEAGPRSASKNSPGNGGAGANSAGAGGGSSRVVITPASGGSPLTFVAGGGGGAGDDAGGIAPGGDAGPVGSAGGGANAGTGGTETAGGLAGPMAGSPADTPVDGAALAGGRGGTAPGTGLSGGGGGGGWFGGGGGGATPGASTTTGGGGGGSNHVPQGVTAEVNGTATGTGDGSVTVEVGGCPTSTKLTATPLDGSARMDFTVPADNGSPITGYQYRVDGGSWTAVAANVSGGSASLVVTGLSNGTSHAVDVRAVNANGPGEVSTASVTPVAVPTAPLNLTATAAGSGAAVLAFDPPAAGSPTGYESSVDGGTTWQSLTTSPGSGTAFAATVDGLANGVATTVRVRALNSSGAGSPAAAGTTLPAGPPSVPVALTGESQNAALALALTPGADGGSPVQRYEYRLNGTGSWVTLPTTVSGSGLTGTVSGLTNGTAYAVEVRAVNAIGAGPARGAGTLTPDVRASAPGLSVSRRDAALTLSITPPTGYGGTPVTGYEASRDDGATWAPLSTSSSGGLEVGTLSGLTNGQNYPVRVRALNAGGPGAASTSRPGTPARPPVLSNVGFVGRDSSARITFAVADGGSPVTGYAYRVASVGSFVPVTPTFTGPGVGYVDVPGLTNGSTDQVRLRATNAVGDTDTADGSVTPYRVSAPSTPTAVPGESSILASWPLPGSLTNVTGYRATAVNGGGSCTVTDPTVRSCVLGAVAGTNDQVTVVSLGANGVDSVPSSPSAAVEADPPTVPAALPPAVPTTLTAVGNPTQPAIGEQVVVVGTGFAPFSTASIAIYSTPTALATVTTDGQGNFSQPVTVPSSLTPGGHTFFAAGVTPTGTTRQMALPVTVALAPVAVQNAPGAPTGLTVTGANNSLALTFVAGPAGTSAITGYEVSTDGGRSFRALTTTTAGGTLRATVTGVANGQSYPVTVRAVSGIGAGAASVVVSATPQAPTLLRLSGNSRVQTSVVAAQQVFPVAARATAAVVATSTTFADSIGGARLAAKVGGPLLLTGSADLDSGVAAEVRRLVRPGGTVYVLGSDSAVSATVADQLADLDRTYEVERLGGANRYATAVRTAEQIGGAGPVYLVSGVDYPDGLTVSALAAATDGTVVLSAGPVLPAVTAQFLARVDPTGARTVPVGGAARTAAGSLPAPAAAAATRAAVVGADRYDTARLLAEGFPGTARAVGLASGTAWPDALVGAAAMGVLQGPLVLTRGDDLTATARTAVTAATDAGARTGFAFGGPNSLEDGPVTAFGRLLRD